MRAATPDTLTRFSMKESRMLVVTIDLVPGGYAPMRRTIASMWIANVSDLAEVSDYRVEASETSNPISGTPPRTAHCFIRGHARAQSVWALLAKAAKAIAKTDTVEP
jgi:hypothetical protein